MSFRLYTEGLARLAWYTVHPAELAAGSPLDPAFFTAPALLAGPHRPAHTADALRLLLVYRFGGLYLDLDFVVLRSLEDFNNILVSNIPSVLNIRLHFDHLTTKLFH